MEVESVEGGIPGIENISEMKMEASTSARPFVEKTDAGEGNLGM